MWSKWSMNILNAASKVTVFYGCKNWYPETSLMSAFLRTRKSQLRFKFKFKSQLRFSQFRNSFRCALPERKLHLIPSLHFYLHSVFIIINRVLIICLIFNNCWCLPYAKQWLRCWEHISELNRDLFALIEFIF